ncbi:MAG: hypothetical protein M0Q24_04445 [Sulfurimonas sp.]|uniref:hypothetical protein n=1 Tax=Sulfurimonas sp. TaxID=2022749 RepID=UPI0025DEAF33|nr:hypothetical protein [Sulfurimonas sp.]MCK9491317.1 hypothetical protein [Sulfurimonas sp.]
MSKKLKEKFEIVSKQIEHLETLRDLFVSEGECPLKLEDNIAFLEGKQYEIHLKIEELDKSHSHNG